MSYGKRPPSYSKRPTYGSSGPPSWLVFLLGVALVFGLYYVWLGFRSFVESGGLGVLESTEQALEQVTATAEQVQQQQAAITLLPTFTPLPECQDFVVIADPSAVVRAGPSTESEPLDTWGAGEIVCVIGREGTTDWFQIDRNPRTRRIEAAFLREDLIEAVNPTPTPSNTFTPAPTVTAVPTDTPTLTFTPAPTATSDPGATDTPSPTPFLTPTTGVRSL